MSAGFKLRKSTDSDHVIELTIASGTAHSAGDLFELDIGATAWTVGDASTEFWQRKAVLIEDTTTTDTTVQAMIVNPWQEWEVQSANSSSADDNNDTMILTDKNTVNNTGTTVAVGTDTAVVEQIAPVGAAANKNILVKFLDSSGFHDN